eukprot:2511072-Rhodomonas_salina.2
MKIEIEQEGNRPTPWLRTAHKSMRRRRRLLGHGQNKIHIGRTMKSIILMYGLRHQTQGRRSLFAWMKRPSTPAAETITAQTKSCGDFGSWPAVFLRWSRFYVSRGISQVAAQNTCIRKGNACSHCGDGMARGFEVPDSAPYGPYSSIVQ